MNYDPSTMNPNLPAILYRNRIRPHQFKIMVIQFLNQKGSIRLVALEGSENSITFYKVIFSYSFTIIHGKSFVGYF
ncbi:MAG: hypothetical protein JWQ54_3485 [Mucilaginibacter sp.]|nr:hypothetical protein [Mucilaginibacter sp.]